MQQRKQVSGQSEWRGIVLRQILKSLYTAGYNPCVLSVDTIEGRIAEEGSDVDIVIFGNWRSIAKHIQTVSCNSKWLLVNYFAHSGYGTQCVIGLDREFLILDIYGQKWRGNGFVFSFSKCFTRVNKGFYEIPNSVSAFEYILVKGAAKTKFSQHNNQRLWKLAKMLDASTIHSRYLTKSIGEKHMDNVLSLLKNGQKLPEETINGLIKGIGKSRVYYSRFALIAYYITEYSRVIHRMMHPSGVSVAVLGPDGSGKSSVVRHIIPGLSAAFRRTQYIHLRPAVGSRWRIGEPVTNPHRQSARSWPVSVAKICYFLFDYVVGWWILVRPMLVRSTLVVFDRYYHDILVDPLRYRYGGPMWLARWVGKLIPSPDLWILLDAPPEVFQARKQEVPLGETTRQRNAYLALIQERDNSVVLDASQPLDKVVTDVNSAILTFLAERTRKRLGS